MNPQRITAPPIHTGVPYIWGCMPIYRNTTINGDGSPCTGVPQWDASPCIGVPQHIGMHTSTQTYPSAHPHTLGYPVIWRCITIYRSTTMNGDGSPCTGKPQWDASPWGTQKCGHASPHRNIPRMHHPLSRVHDLVQTTPTQTLAIHVQT